MPRPPEVSPLRRVLEQTVMWLILAATVGAAAWVDARKDRLGEPRSFDGITLRLPKGWEPADDDGSDGRIALRDDAGERTARTITVRSLTFEELAELVTSIQQSSEEVKMRDGGAAKITVVTRPLRDQFGARSQEMRVLAIVTAPGGKSFMISIRHPHSDKSHADVNVRLMKRILESVNFGS